MQLSLVLLRQEQVLCMMLFFLRFQVQHRSARENFPALQKGRSKESGSSRLILCLSAQDKARDEAHRKKPLYEVKNGSGKGLRGCG